MGSCHWQYRSCGKCKRCIATGGRGVHGPYPYHWEGRGKSRKHRYGGGSGGGGSSSTEPIIPENADQMRQNAQDEADQILKNLTPEQQRKLDNVMGRLAEIKKVQRNGKKEMERKTKEGKERGWTALAIEGIVSDISRQIVDEVGEIGKQLKREQRELERMIGG